MSKQIPSYLKLVTETPLPTPRVDEDLAALTAVCEAFQPATGFSLEVGSQTGLKLTADEAGKSSSKSKAKFHAEPEAVKSLATAIDKLWQELLLTRRALWQREADLAAGVPVVEHRDEARQMAARLEAVLKSGAEAVNCHAAALYLLDDATSELKLRASWGLPRRRLTDEPRPLENQLADLEAMLGHAVVLCDPQMFGLWRVPENCAATVCVPVSSATMPLGTLWIYSQVPRDFSSAETNLIEVVAGRLAADLEREALLSQIADDKQTRLTEQSLD